MKLSDQNATQNLHQWLNGNYDDQTKQAIQQMLDENKVEEITDAFYKNLEFGTGGLRGIMGVGPNRVNKYTIGAATQGLSNYLIKAYPHEQIKVVIAHDNRNNAEYFSQITADVFSANGIQVYFFDGLRPTPELSFAIRQLECKSGIMLTASHNPKEYSGYKAYWNDGGQVVPPHDANIIQEVLRIDSVDKIRFEPDHSLIQTIGAEIDRLFLESVMQASMNPEAIKQQHHLNIVFSPIHGAGVHMVPKALRKAGFTNVHLVEEQCVTDGDFPTVVYPNPEEKEALNMALALAEKVNAELVMATDPDGDRVGIAVRDNNSQLVLLNGNQTATLLFHYLLEQWEAKGLITGNEYVVKTVVTTYLIDKIAQSKGVKCYNVLTGFKYIGELMTRLEGKETFIAGAEESYGYLVGDHVRDKDAVVACVLIAEMAAHYKNNGKTLYETLMDIYVQYGFYKEDLISVTKKGKRGAEEINELMASFRSNPPEKLGGMKVIRVKDYLRSEEHDLVTGEKSKIDLPKSNVMQFITQGENIISARPSGTEPKIKYYISVNGTLDSPENVARIDKELTQRLTLIKNDLM